MLILNELALFAGAGGGLLASKWLLGWRTVCYVENAEYPVKVIQARIKDGLLDDAPIWDDARTFDGRPWRGCVDIITAGFPCQPFSEAGKRLADNDERDMWPDTIRIIREVKPDWCLLENVSGLLAGSHGYFGTILGELAKSGYDVRWRVLSAAELGAPHKRDRVWIVAYPTRQQMGMAGQPWETPGPNGKMAYAASTRQPDIQGKRTAAGAPGRPESRPETWWNTEPSVDRVADGVAHRVDRISAIANGQVPIVAAVVWELLTATG